MKSRLTCHRAVSPKITPYCGLLICCLLRYLVALHSALSLNSGIVTLTKIKEIMLAHSLTSVQDKQEITVNRTNVNQLKLTS